MQNESSAKKFQSTTKPRSSNATQVALSTTGFILHDSSLYMKCIGGSNVGIGGGLALDGLIVAMVGRIYPGEGQQGLFRFVYVYIRSIAFGESLEQVGEFKALGRSYKELFGDDY